MFDCVAVTRNGLGRAWGFASRTEADLHPLIQYGDAIVCEPDDVTEQWGWMRLPRLISEVIGDRDYATVIRDRLVSSGDLLRREQVMREEADRCWRELQRVASAPPADPATVLEMITQDRILHEREHSTERRTLMTDVDKSKTPSAAKEPKAPKPAAVKKIAGLHPNSTIKFGTNAESKAYNTSDNNPKRAGSQAHASFAMYAEGKTLQQLVDAGVRTADLNWDLKHGFIEAVAPKAAPAA